MLLEEVCRRWCRARNDHGHGRDARNVHHVPVPRGALSSRRGTHRLAGRDPQPSPRPTRVRWCRGIVEGVSIDEASITEIGPARRRQTSWGRVRRHPEERPQGEPDATSHPTHPAHRRPGRGHLPRRADVRSARLDPSRGRPRRRGTARRRLRLRACLGSLLRHGGTGLRDRGPPENEHGERRRVTRPPGRASPVLPAAWASPASATATARRAYPSTPRPARFFVVCPSPRESCGVACRSGLP